MQIECDEAPIATVAELGQISIAFVVNSVYDLVGAPTAPGGVLLSERTLDTPYVKDYDDTPGEKPSEWRSRFDVSNWGYIRAQTDGYLVGGAAIAFDTAAVNLLEGRRDLAVLWDIRVVPEVRGKGVGSQLFREVENWAARRGCGRLKVETQNINVPACRFYIRQGCELGAVNPKAYALYPQETQLLWFKNL